MKRTIHLIVASIFATMGASAQTIAPDWTLTDCSGTSHQLYNYLNNEEVVIMEFGMGCASCTDAAPPLIGKRNAYAATHPGKVKAMYMDYWTGNDCVTDIVPVVGTYDFDGIFGHCNTEKSFYFGTNSPMPGIVVAAGSSHEVIYQQMSFSVTDTVAIGQAIDSFFMALTVREQERPGFHFSVYPNPALENLSVETNGPSQLAIMDMTGKQVMAFSCNGSINIPVATWPNGIYVVMDLEHGTTVKWLKE